MSAERTLCKGLVCASESVSQEMKFKSDSFFLMMPQMIVNLDKKNVFLLKSLMASDIYQAFSLE